MKERQESIYLISGKTKKEVLDLQMLKMSKQKRIEDLFFSDSIDEYSFCQLKYYNDHNLIFIDREKYEIDETEDEKSSI
jgi:HSP90 family molecular chaperone